ncbi:MAG: HlyD family efflux transporter periplasmic adaptor subunit [Nostoc sp. NMS1]|uniref:HlyD family efflux transporter periplasmic adaptor subunit n=1 Tax=unclassified Nostoc TaxID=2593658 RepID=UPI0025EA0591|nr:MULTISPECIES: HlyD family efflux transporter periplasmic adaptor subunit [unclassified Nostoc]MBN3909477.1 HlyD family efflux transporter periplasmic adaptor subunit [Nostoc sp. NMS1]MBN3994286.1 HlyD family efflux transporter periplasmic adaptor subunit [Nostoc sp. NMS2]
MPSPNRSSPLPQDERDEYQSYTSEEESGEVNQQTETESTSLDLHYGTEGLLNALPRLWTRGLLYVLIAFAGLFLPWATLSKVDETGSARGRIEPKGATQKLDAQAGGSVKTVMVKEGDTVRAGQVLVELESDLLQTELQQTQSKLQGLQNRQSQLELLKNQLLMSTSLLEQQNKSQELEKMAQVNQAKQNLEAKLSSQNLQKLEKQALVEQAQQQIYTTNNDQQSAQARLSIDSRQVQRFSKLVQDGAVSATQVDQLKKEEQESKRLYRRAVSDIKQAQLQLTGELNRYQVTINTLESDIKQAKLRLQEEQSSYESLIQAGKLAVMKNQEQLKDIQAQITAAQSEVAQTKSQITSIRVQMQQRVVRSPINGVIFELPTTKPGAVVQPGQRIAQIAPQNTDFVLKANIPNQDSGFLKVGMPVKVKFDAYPFQEYGIVQGKVTWISPDSKVSQTPQGNIEIYELEITLDQQYVQTGNKRIPLGAGQTANAEVIIRQRRVIDFVLDPFKKLQKGGLEI